MTIDITRILNDWPYEPGQVTARKIRGDDGVEKIQLRLDLGILQMEVIDRPDGQRPNGFDSELAYHQHRLLRHRQDHPSDEGFVLDPRTCESLRAEGVMFYHRYLAAFVLGDFALVQRDTRRNLQMLDFLRAYAEEDADRFASEQYRPYILMMNARARAKLALAEGRPRLALSALRTGIRRIQEFYRDYHDEEGLAHSGELALLKQLADEISTALPVDPIEKIRDELTVAIRNEQYEHAARLRDRLRKMANESGPHASGEGHSQGDGDGARRSDGDGHSRGHGDGSGPHPS